MRKFASILLRLIFVAAVGVSGFLMIESPITVNVQNVRGLAQTVIKKSVNNTGDSRLKSTLKLAKDFGVEDKILEQLPKKYHHDMSYTSLYNLGASYQENGEVTAKSLSFPENNDVQKAVSKLLLNKINDGLKENQNQVNQSITIFHYCFFAAILIFILSALLILFGKYWAAIILLIASVGSFGALQFLANQLVQWLESNVAQGISLTVSSVLWAGLAVGVITALIWPLVLKLTKKE